MKKIESYLRWLSIVLFAILAIMATVPTLAMLQNAGLRSKGMFFPPYYFPSPFYLLLIASILFWFIVVRFLFQDFYSRGQLHGRVKRFHEQVLAHPLQKIYGTIVRSAEVLSARIVVFGLGIAIIVGFLAAAGSLDEVGYYFSIPFSWTPPIAMGERRVMFLDIHTPDNNLERYLETTLKTARELRQAGTRVMIVELPWFQPTERTFQLVSDLNNTGIVVFGTHYPLSRYYRTIQHPLLNKLDLSWGQYTSQLSQLYYDRSSRTAFSLPRFIPYGVHDTRTDKPVPDVVVEALRKYDGASEIRAEGSAIIVGKRRLPTSSDGTLYISMRDNIVNVLLLTLQVSMVGSEVEYTLYNRGGINFVRSDGELLKGSQSDFKDKIVLTGWSDAVGAFRVQENWNEMFQYAVFLDCALAGKNLLRYAERWPIVITLLSLLLCGVVARYLRGLYAVPAMILAGLGLVLSARWLFLTHDILLDVSYPLAAIILCTAILPLVRFAYTMRSFETTPTSGRFSPSLGFAPELPTRMAPALEITQQQPSRTRFVFTGKRLSLSFPLAALVIVLSIAGSTTLTYLWLNATLKPRTEVVYVPTLPTVEVEGYYSKSGN